MKTFQAIAAVSLGLFMTTQAVALPAPDVVLEDDQSLGTPTRLVIIYPGGNGLSVTRTVILEPTGVPAPTTTNPPKWPWYPKPTSTTTSKTTTKPVITKAPEPTPSDIFIPIRTITLE